MVPRNHPFKIKQIPTKRKPGRISQDIPHKREDHEKTTVARLARFGYDIQLIKPSGVPHSHTPDCRWRGEFWEIKSPVKNSSQTIISAAKEGASQSKNLIIDVSRTNRDIRQVASDLTSYMKKHRRTKIRKVFIVDKTRYCEISKSMVV